MKIVNKTNNFIYIYYSIFEDEICEVKLNKEKYCNYTQAKKEAIRLMLLHNLEAQYCLAITFKQWPIKIVDYHIVEEIEGNMKHIINEVNIFYINRKNELFCQLSNKNLPNDCYQIGQNVKLVCFSSTITGVVSDITKSGIVLRKWHIGEDL